jgi:Amt family ammonium transporter
MVLVLGKRVGWPKEPMPPHNLPVVMIGTGILWFGWFGFNAGSSLTSGGLASNAFVATNTSAAAAAFTWMMLGWLHRRPSLLGVATGAVAGLVAITPAAGFVSPLMGIPIGVGAAIVCYYCILFRLRSGVDESLDVWAVHGMGGVWGALATGIFASLAVNSAGADGLIYGNAVQIAKQAAAIASVFAFAFAATWVLGKLVDLLIGLRVSRDEESVGLDISQHGEKAYGGL